MKVHVHDPIAAEPVHGRDGAGASVGDTELTSRVSTGALEHPIGHGVHREGRLLASDERRARLGSALRRLLSTMLLVALAPLGGCYDWHARGDASDASVDARSISIDARGIDAPAVPLDAPPVPFDAPFSCPLARPHVLCAPNLLFPAMEAFALELTFVQPICGERPRCEVRIEGTVLHLSTQLCPLPPGADCAPRGTTSVSCELPPLPPARYTIVANGAAATEIMVDFDSGVLPTPPFCTTLATVDECRASAPLPGTRDDADEVCLGLSTSSDEIEFIELRDTCAECPFYDGTCTVTVEPRLTFDLPPGGEIRVHPRIFSGACDGPCDPSCEEHIRRCAIPRLNAGDYYRVWLEDAVRPSFEWVEGVDEPPCGPGIP